MPQLIGAACRTAADSPDELATIDALTQEFRGAEGSSTMDYHVIREADSYGGFRSVVTTDPRDRPMPG